MRHKRQRSNTSIMSDLSNISNISEHSTSTGGYRTTDDDILDGLFALNNDLHLDYRDYGDNGMQNNCKNNLS